MKKKLLTIFLIIITVVCSAFAFTACGDKNDEGHSDEKKTISGTEGLEYTLSDDGTYYILSGLGTCTQTEIVIGSYYNGKPVKSIGDGVFNGYSSLTSIAITDSVTKIGNQAFKDCNNLKSATIPALAISYIPNINLKTVTITSGEIIEREAFKDCINLRSIILSDSVTSIGKSAFRGCSNLESITIGNGVTYIGESAFHSCNKLTRVTIPDKVTSIGDWAFCLCDNLRSVTIPVVVTEIGSYAFRGCSSLMVIHFKGTKAQWGAIEKGSGWNVHVNNYTIYCTDGDITKE